MPTPTELHCSSCPETFADLTTALRHCRREHGMTRQQAQNELKIHRRKR